MTNSTGTSRRVAAIVFSDIVDYTARMAESETQGLRLRDLHRALWTDAAAQGRGRIVDENGDELVLLFDSAVDAARAARQVQGATEAQAELPLRVGIHLGDLLIRDGAPFGEGVNFAARIRAEARPGQVVISEEVERALRNQADLQSVALGRRALKNVPGRARLFALADGAADSAAGRPGPSVSASRRRRIAGVASGALLVVLVLATAMPVTRDRLVAGLLVRAVRLAPGPEGHEIAFTQSADGTRIAWGSLGSGPPVVMVQPWLTHAEHMTSRLPILVELARSHRVVHYDGRGFGLSQRRVDYTLEAVVQDLEAVVAAAGLERFAILSVSSGGPIAMTYGVRHPERVTRLAMLGGWARNLRDPAEGQAVAVLMLEHFGTHRFESFFRELLVPDATEFQVYFLNQAFGPAGHREDVAAYFRMLLTLDVREQARAFPAPTLIAHRRGDHLIPLEAALELATLIPHSRLLLLDGQNHFFLPGEEEGERFAAELIRFLAADRDADTL